MKIQIPFKEVKIGESFISKRTKRCFGCMKIKETSAVDNTRMFLAKAVILTDHAGEPADDRGTLVGFDDNTIVEVDRESVPS